MFSLKLLGCAALENDGVPVTGRAVHRRRLALLAVLAAARGRMVGRERVIGYLWPEHSGDAARHLLSESLYILRKALGDEAFLSAGDELALDLSVVRSDVADFHRALEDDNPERAVALYAGPFLDGFYVADAPDFERWAEQERDRLARAQARALEALAEAAEAEAQPLRAAEWWKRLAREDPYSSRIALRVMQALEAGGERAAAVRHASVHAALVRSELGAEPDAEIEAFARRLRDAPRPAPAPPPVAEPAPALAAASAGEGATAVLEAPPAVAAEPAVSPSPAPRREETVVPTRPRPRLTRLRIAAIVGMVAAIVLVSLFLYQRASREQGDASLFIVLPFKQGSGPGASALSPDQAELLVYDALSRWRDVRVVDAQRARDLMARRGTPSTLDQARRIAADAGAGRLLWGEITPLGDSVAVRAALYDLSDGGSLAQRTVRVGRDLHGVSQRIGDLVAALVGRGGSSGEAAGTNSLAAWQAYQRGRTALANWDLDRARDELGRAVVLDPGFARAHLWLAQAQEWSGPGVVPRVEWRGHAASALSDSIRLSPRERELGWALSLLGDRRFPEACAAYRAMVARDSTDFTGWYGLGDCQNNDRVVVRDPASPSGWRFRSSANAALMAYARALRTVPSALQAFRGSGFKRLQELLQTSGFVRPGIATGPAPGDTLLFAAYAALEGDTIVYVPWPREDVAALKKETIPPTRGLADTHNRGLLVDVLKEWTRAFPRSADAHEALARGLEEAGQIRAVRQGAPSAFSEIALARGLAEDREQRLRLAVAQVRLDLRVGDFARARARADSVFARWPEPGPRDALAMAPLAVLTGRAGRAGSLLRTAAPERGWFFTPRGDSVEIAVPVAEAQADVLAAAALGTRAEVRQAEARLQQLLAAWVDAPRVGAARSALLNGPRRLAGAYGIAPEAPLADADYMVEMQQMVAAGDAAGVRARMAAMREALGTRRPGDMDLSFVFPQAALRLALGDAAGAQEELDRTLLTLQALPYKVLDTPEEAGGLVGIIRQRIQLATATGDTRTAAYWRNALSTLWANADPALKTTVR